MKEFIEKLIGRLEEERKEYTSEYGLIDMQVQEVFVNVRKIVNELAEEYKSRIMIDEEYCWQKCSAVEHCSECNRLENGTIDYFENYDSLVEKYNNGWIPCSERLPEDSEYVLCWYEYRIMQGTCIGKMAHRYGIGWYSKKSDIWVGEVSVGVYCRVIAWMPFIDSKRRVMRHRSN